MKSSINLKIGGAAGEGIKSVGLILSKSFVRAGFYTFDYTEYPSLIRGGHNTYQAHISSQKVHSQIKAVDILVALNRETIDLHQGELSDSSLVIYDPNKLKLGKKNKFKGQYLPVPLEKLATEAKALPIMANNVALGVIIFLTGGQLAILKEVISQSFGKKDQKIVYQNQQAAQAGFNYAAGKFSAYKLTLGKPKKRVKQILITGNEVVALGAIAGGMKFYAAYPMTPTTSILHYLAAKAKKCQLVVKHAEDEISVINMALGAAFAGVRSMVATSGGGFSLMTEALGMAGMMELPIVIVEGMRTGPSTGMPTWHDQGDLKFVISASQGEFPRMVLAPGDTQESFELTRKAFYFAEKYQLPVIILIDKYLAESIVSILKPQTVWQNKRYSLVNLPISPTFKRYASSKDGISLRSLPGQEGGAYLSNSYEHDELGFATEASQERNKMVDKRLRKFEALNAEVKDLKQPLFDSAKAKIGLVSWGSNKGPILQALEILKNNKLEVAFLNLNLVWPLPKQQVKEFILSKKVVVDIECNATAQLAELIKEQTGLAIEHKLLKYDGRPFYPEEIVEYIKDLRKNFKIY